MDAHWQFRTVLAFPRFGELVDLIATAVGEAVYENITTTLGVLMCDVERWGEEGRVAC